MGLQRKLARLEGFMPIKDQDALKEKIAELQKNLEAEVSTNGLLNTQIRKIEVQIFSLIFSLFNTESG